MAHNLLGSRFYNRSTNPAWHGLGINDETDHTAEEALRRVGYFGIQKQPLYATLPPDRRMESGFYALVRDPIPEDNQYRIIGTPVTDDYEVIDPIAAARLWDSSMCDAAGQPVPIETLGILGQGERMFITTQLPSVDVRGDEVAIYLLLDTPFHNGISLGGYTTGVRVVCQNTLNAGIYSAREQFRVTHTTGALKEATKWVSGMYGRALENRALLEEAYNILANKPVNDLQVRWIVEGAYPLPDADVWDSPSSRLPLEVRQEQRDRWIERTIGIRQEVINLYHGKGTAMNTVAVEGTAFGAYNAVSEYETYGRRGGYSRAVGSLINGERGSRIATAFNLAMNADKYEVVSLEAARVEVI